MKVIHKLKNPSTFEEALFQIYIAKCIIDEFNIEFLEEGNKSKIVDWKITDPVTKDEFMVELTESRFETSEEKENLLAFKTIVKSIMENCKVSRGITTLFYRGRLFKPYISKPTLQQLISKIDSTAKEAHEKGFAELIERNTISLALATADKKHLLIPWAIKKNVLNQHEANRECSGSSFSGVPYPIDEVKRIKSKIEDKKKQFDRKALNALVIRSHRLFIPAYIEHYIDILKELLYDHEYLVMLIVVGGHVGGQELNSIEEKDAHLYLIRSIDLITKEILILTNIHSKNNVKTLNLSSKIKIAFKRCQTLLF